jgi:hypothetical protein
MKVAEIAAELEADFLEIQKPRSDVQLAAFVAGGHDTTPRQWQQVVLEMQIKIDNIEHAAIKLSQQEREIKRLRNGTEEQKEEGALLMIGQRSTKRAMLGAMRELETLYRIYKTMPRFTREQIEEAEAGYWRARITRQAAHGIISRVTGIGVGDLDTLKQLGIPVNEVIEQVRPCLEQINKSLGQSANSGALALPSPDTLPADSPT